MSCHSLRLSAVAKVSHARYGSSRAAVAAPAAVQKAAVMCAADASSAHET